MNGQYKTISLIILAMLTTHAQAAKIIDEKSTKAVGNVVWHKQAAIDPTTLLDKAIPANTASVFFIRPTDQDGEQTSANIAINDRFQVSLQPGSYSQVYSCAGVNMLSAKITGLKTNNLMQSTQTYTLEGGQVYFFYIDVDTSDTSNQVVIKQITKDSALQVLKGKQYQTHQISRVVTNCPVAIKMPVVQVQVPVPPPPAPPTPKPAPVLKEKVSITLKVLFDNDKAEVKPEYLNEVANVAEFMKKYGHTQAVIEGHTDSNASETYNQKLSQSRADAVRDILINQFGIDADRLTAIGYGESKPIASNTTAEGRYQNRRVIAVIEERP